MVFICHVTLQRLVMKAFYDWLGAPTVTGHTTKFDGHTHFGSGEMIILNCHMISHCHVIIESCEFMVGSLSWKVTILSVLVAMGTVVLEM